MSWLSDILFQTKFAVFFCLSKLYVQIPKISKITCIIVLNLSNGYGWAWPQSTWLAGPLLKIFYNRYISYNNIATLNKAFDDGSGSGLSLNFGFTRKTQPVVEAGRRTRTTANTWPLGHAASQWRSVRMNMNSGKTIGFFYLFQHWTNAMRGETRAHQIASAKKFLVARMTVFV